MSETTGFTEPGLSFRRRDFSDIPEPDHKDYILQDSRTRETRRRDAEGIPWRSADVLLRAMAADEAAYWSAEADFYESLLTEHHEGGGTFGLDPVAHVVRAGLVALGSAEDPV